MCGVQSLMAPADHQHEQFVFTDGEQIRRGIPPVPQAHVPALFFQEPPGLVLGGIPPPVTVIATGGGLHVLSIRRLLRDAW